ncbi:MAG: hypothetical protein M3Y41_03880 [Pseudomonadota bacterium]|nr:hypothetical protein [Pseudomonadota bacterium]
MNMRAIGGSALAAVLLAGPLAAPGFAPFRLVQPAAAQMQTREGIALQNQVLQLQREVEILQQQIASGAAANPGYSAYGQSAYPPTGAAPPNGASGDMVTQLLTRVDALEGTVRELRGRLEELQNQVQQQSADLGKRIDDLRFSVQNQQSHGSAEGPVVGTAPPPTALRPPAPLGGPQRGAFMTPAAGRPTGERALDEGDAALARRDYQMAERNAREVLSARTSAHAYDAQFLLAQALLGERAYSQAAIAYDDAYNRSKRGAHAPESLLGLADALAAINERRAACDTLSKLRAEFPAPRPELRDRITRAGQRANCRQ